MRNSFTSLIIDLTNSFRFVFVRSGKGIRFPVMILNGDRSTSRFDPDDNDDPDDDPDEEEEDDDDEEDDEEDDEYEDDIVRMDVCIPSGKTLFFLISMIVLDSSNA